MTRNGTVKNGRVKWFDKVKGYGFIFGDDGKDVFVHYSVVPGKEGDKNLMEGDIVSYVEDTRDGRLYATEVVTIVRS